MTARLIQVALAGSLAVALIGSLALADSVMRLRDEATVAPLASFRVCLVVTDAQGFEYIAGVGDNASQALRGAELPDDWREMSWYDCAGLVTHK